MRLLGSVPASTMKSSAARFGPTDVLYGRLRPYLNKVAMPGFDGLCSAEFIIFPDTPHLRSPFLRYRLNSSDFVSFAAHLNEGDRPRVDFDQIGKFEILLPPEPEQRRIVAKIEELFSHLDAGVAALERARANLKRYRAAVLKGAVEGRLTEEWRRRNPDVEPASKLLERILAERRRRWEEERLTSFEAKGKALPKGWKDRYVEPEPPDSAPLTNLPNGWCWAMLPQLGVLDRGRSKHRPRNAPHLYGGPYPFIQTGDVREADTLIARRRQTYSEAGLKQSRLWPQGTLCITIAANIAESAILTFDACFPDSVVGFLPFSSGVSVRYVHLFLRTIQQRLEASAPATAQKNINLETLAQVAVPLPPIQEQEQIVAEVDRCLSLERACESTVCTQLTRASQLRHGILKSAFNGRLLITEESQGEETDRRDEQSKMESRSGDSPLFLFDQGGRLDKAVKRPTESRFAFLNRSARPQVVERRAMWTDWFGRYPDDAKKELRGRFRSRKDDQHAGAAFELFLHELALRIGGSVEVHPAIRPEIAKRPDFRVSLGGRPSFYLEATLAGPSQEERAAAARRRGALDSLNRLEVPQFRLDLDESGQPGTEVPIRQWKADLLRWLKSLPVETIYAAQRAGESRAGPRKVLQHGRWRLTLTAVAKEPSKRHEANKRLIRSRSQSFAGAPAVHQIRDSVAGKSTRYGELDLPFIVAVRVEAWDCDSEDMMEALFGSQGTLLELVGGRPRRLHPVRNRDGLWNQVVGPRNRNVSAVLVCYGLDPGDLIRSTPVLIHNPWARRALDPRVWPLPQRLPDSKRSRLVLVEGKEINQVLALPSLPAAADGEGGQP